MNVDAALAAVAKAFIQGRFPIEIAVFPQYVTPQTPQSKEFEGLVGRCVPFVVDMGASAAALAAKLLPAIASAFESAGLLESHPLAKSGEYVSPVVALWLGLIFRFRALHIAALLCRSLPPVIEAANAAAASAAASGVPVTAVDLVSAFKAENIAPHKAGVPTDISESAVESGSLPAVGADADFDPLDAFLDDPLPDPLASAPPGVPIPSATIAGWVRSHIIGEPGTGPDASSREPAGMARRGLVCRHFDVGLTLEDRQALLLNGVVSSSSTDDAVDSTDVAPRHDNGSGGAGGRGGRSRRGQGNSKFDGFRLDRISVDIYNLGLERTFDFAALLASLPDLFLEAHAASLKQLTRVFAGFAPQSAVLAFRAKNLRPALDECLARNNLKGALALCAALGVPSRRFHDLTVAVAKKSMFYVVKTNRALELAHILTQGDPHLVRELISLLAQKRKIFEATVLASRYHIPMNQLPYLERLVSADTRALDPRNCQEYAELEAGLGPQSPYMQLPQEVQVTVVDTDAKAADFAKFVQMQIASLPAASAAARAIAESAAASAVASGRPGSIDPLLLLDARFPLVVGMDSEFLVSFSGENSPPLLLQISVGPKHVFLIDMMCVLRVRANESNSVPSQSQSAAAIIRASLGPSQQQQQQQQRQQKQPAHTVTRAFAESISDAIGAMFASPLVLKLGQAFEGDVKLLRRAFGERVPGFCMPCEPLMCIGTAKSALDLLFAADTNNTATGSAAATTAGGGEAQGSKDIGLGLQVDGHAPVSSSSGAPGISSTDGSASTGIKRPHPFASSNANVVNGSSSGSGNEVTGQNEAVTPGRIMLSPGAKSFYGGSSNGNGNGDGNGKASPGVATPTGSPTVPPTTSASATTGARSAATSALTSLMNGPISNVIDISAVEAGRATGATSKWGIIGLAKVVEAALGKPLCKGPQVSDWARRPLAPFQVMYGALDAWTPEQSLRAVLTEAGQKGSGFEAWVRIIATVHNVPGVKFVR